MATNRDTPKPTFQDALDCLKRRRDQYRRWKRTAKKQKRWADVALYDSHLRLAKACIRDVKTLQK